MADAAFYSGFFFLSHGAAYNFIPSINHLQVLDKTDLTDDAPLAVRGRADSRLDLQLRQQQSLGNSTRYSGPPDAGYRYPGAGEDQIGAALDERGGLRRLLLHESTARMAFEGQA
jgi:hypothetical protein